eukprot:GFUD01119661.1.p1 GENE.GFUD01119661.1~~GFUD01119661.1.p1  ORF type:complete len:252 (+),score=31.78 GFUD01119661.1:55-810(+)
MRSLRSLCLLKVHSLGLDMSPMPPSLAKDIKIVRLFNRNFIGEVYLDYDFEFGLFVHQNAFSIQYDGASWSFLYRSNHFQADCCPHCDFVEPDLEQFTLEAGKLVPVPPQFDDFRHGQGNEDLMMNVSFTMEEDGTSGKIELKLFKDSVPIPIQNPTIWMKAGRPTVGCRLRWFNRLAVFQSDGYIETPDPIQDVFITPLYHTCIFEAIMLLNDWDPDGIFGLDDVMSAIDEAFNEPDDFLEDFWKFVVVE